MPYYYGPGMLKSPYNIAADATFIDAARTALRTQADALSNNMEGTRAGDVESLHDMRVASRRLRAAMSVFSSAFPDKQFRPLEREAARITDALGAVRDADVQIEYLEALRDAAPAVEQVGLDSLLDHLRDDRERERDLLIKELGRLAHGPFWRDLHRMTATDDLVSAPDLEETSAADVSRDGEEGGERDG
jgi:CHAD domain-containing protein